MAAETIPATQPPVRPPSEHARRKIESAVGNRKQAELARILGVHRSHVSCIFSGRRRPSLEIAAKIAGTIKVSIDDLYSYLVHESVN